jgi:acyl carrier protein
MPPTVRVEASQALYRRTVGWYKISNAVRYGQEAHRGVRTATEIGGRRMATTDRVRDFIMDELRWRGNRADLTDDYPLLENGVIDSLGLFRIVEFLESQCGVEIDDRELVPTNFAAIARLAEHSQ